MKQSFMHSWIPHWIFHEDNTVECSLCGGTFKLSEINDVRICPDCKKEITLQCEDCRTYKYFPELHCCFNCAHIQENNSTCNIQHTCGEDCWNWSPKASDINSLQDTVTLMNSSDYRERFKAEYYQVKIRYNKLKNMIKDWDEGKLNFTPTCDRAIYDRQIEAMLNYIGCLESRAYIEKIKL